MTGRGAALQRMRRSHGHSPSWPSKPRTAAHPPKHPSRALTRLRLRGLFADGPAEAGFVGSPRSNTRQAAGKPRISCLSSKIGKSTQESHEHVDPAGFRQIATDFRSDADQKPFSAACRPLARAPDGPVRRLRAAPRTFSKARQIGTATSFAPACPYVRKMPSPRQTPPHTGVCACMRKMPAPSILRRYFASGPCPMRARCLLRYIRRSAGPTCKHHTPRAERGLGPRASAQIAGWWAIRPSAQSHGLSPAALARMRTPTFGARWSKA